MSWSWYIYSPILPVEMLDVEEAYDDALQAFFEAYPEVDDPFGEAVAGGQVPGKNEVVKQARETGAKPGKKVLERLSGCKSAMEIGSVPSEGLDSRLQVSILQFLLGKIGPCVFDWGDYELELSENTIEKLGARENRGPLSPSRSPSKSSGGDNLKLKNLPGVSQSARIVQMLQRISRDLDLSIDIKRKLSEEPNLISDYARLLVLEGAKDHAAAAEHLGIEPGEAEEVAIRLEGLLEGLLN